LRGSAVPARGQQRALLRFTTGTLTQHNLLQEALSNQFKNVFIGMIVNNTILAKLGIHIIIIKKIIIIELLN